MDWSKFEFYFRHNKDEGNLFKVLCYLLWDESIVCELFVFEGWNNYESDSGRGSSSELSDHQKAGVRERSRKMGGIIKLRLVSFGLEHLNTVFSMPTRL